MQPKASVAANTGTGPDMFWSLYSTPHLSPTAASGHGTWRVSRQEVWRLGPGCGGLRQARQQVDRDSRGHQRRLHQLPHLGREGRRLRQGAGRHRRLPRALQGVKAKGNASRLPARPRHGRRQFLRYWLLWSHNAAQVDENSKVIIRSPETEAALNYAKALYDTYVQARSPGTMLQQPPGSSRANSI